MTLCVPRGRGGNVWCQSYSLEPAFPSQTSAVLSAPETGSITWKVAFLVLPASFHNPSLSQPQLKTPMTKLPGFCHDLENKEDLAPGPSGCTVVTSPMERRFPHREGDLVLFGGICSGLWTTGTWNSGRVEGDAGLPLENLGGELPVVG